MWNEGAFGHQQQRLTEPIQRQMEARGSNLLKIISHVVVVIVVEFITELIIRFDFLIITHSPHPQPAVQWSPLDAGPEEC